MEFDKKLFAVAIADEKIGLETAVALRPGAFGNMESVAVEGIKEILSDVEATYRLLASLGEAGAVMMVLPTQMRMGRSIVYDVFQRSASNPLQWQRFPAEAMLTPEQRAETLDATEALDRLEATAEVEQRPVRPEAVGDLAQHRYYRVEIPVDVKEGTSEPVGLTITMTKIEDGAERA